MSTITLMRIYLKYQSLPRLPLPCIGYAGILYTTPMIDRQKNIVRGEIGRMTAMPELNGTSSIVTTKGSMGSYFFRRGFSTSVDDIKKAEKERLDKAKKVWSAETVKVILVCDKGSVSTVTLADANKLAKKQGMNLIHVTNAKDKPVKTDKDVYKLVSRLSNLNEDEEGDETETPVHGGEKGRIRGSDSSNNSKQKELKTVLMKSNIGEHDVYAKVNLMKKWIKKGHRVRVQISQAGDKGSSESVFQKVEEEMKTAEGQIQQKIIKGNELRFYVGPPKTPKVESEKESEKKVDSASS